MISTQYLLLTMHFLYLLPLEFRCTMPTSFWVFCKKMGGFKGMRCSFLSACPSNPSCHFFLNIPTTNFQVDKGFALSVSNKLVACACSSGIVQLFTVENIKYVGSLLYSETNDPNLTSVPSRHGNSEKSAQGAAACPDAIACQFTTSKKLGKRLPFTMYCLS